MVLLVLLFPLVLPALPALLFLHYHWCLLAHLGLVVHLVLLFLPILPAHLVLPARLRPERPELLLVLTVLRSQNYHWCLPVHSVLDFPVVHLVLPALMDLLFLHYRYCLPVHLVLYFPAVHLVLPVHLVLDYPPVLLALMDLLFLYCRWRLMVRLVLNCPVVHLGLVDLLVLFHH